MVFWLLACRRTVAVALALVALGALPACGESSGEDEPPVLTQRVTHEFGRELVAVRRGIPLEGHRNALRLLRAFHAVGMSEYGSGVVEIDGVRRREDEPHETTWAHIVNGIETDGSPQDYRLHPGDVVQWDYRDWYATLDVRATVGAFPETFTQGVFGKLFPVTVRCELPSSTACRRVTGALERAGVPTDGSPRDSELPRRGATRRAQIRVGTWRHWRDARWGDVVEAGPRYSGIFARFAPDGRSLRLLDWNTRRVREEGAGTGLVGAMRPSAEDLVWLVTGVDRLGVERAARALDSAALRGAFAVAVTGDGVEKLPLVPVRRARRER